MGGASNFHISGTVKLETSIFDTINNVVHEALTIKCKTRSKEVGKRSYM